MLCICIAMVWLCKCVVMAPSYVCYGLDWFCFAWSKEVLYVSSGWIDDTLSSEEETNK
jgi:hypothetical protein